MKKRKLGGRLLAGALSVLGFVGCDGVGEVPDMYGCPIVDFQVKGAVTSEDGTPLKGIRVITRTSWDNNAYGADTVYTDAKGEFKSRELASIAIGKQKVYLDDVDGEENGGAFKSDSINLRDMEKKQLNQENGWYAGKYEYSAKDAVKLKKEEKKSEE